MMRIDDTDRLWQFRTGDIHVYAGDDAKLALYEVGTDAGLWTDEALDLRDWR